ncbi:MAG: hypothetical protein AAF417_22245 [Pseudomonadota bacterium]
MASNPPSIRGGGIGYPDLARDRNVASKKVGGSQPIDSHLQAQKAPSHDIPDLQVAAFLRLYVKPRQRVLENDPHLKDIHRNLTIDQKFELKKDFAGRVKHTVRELEKHAPNGLTQQQRDSIAQDEYRNAIIHVARRTSVLNEVADRGDLKSRMLVARNRFADPQTLDSLASATYDLGQEKVVEEIAKNPAARGDTLEHIALPILRKRYVNQPLNDSEMVQLRNLASNPHTPLNVLQFMIDHTAGLDGDRIASAAYANQQARLQRSAPPNPQGLSANAPALPSGAPKQPLGAPQDQPKPSPSNDIPPYPSLPRSAGKQPRSSSQQAAPHPSRTDPDLANSAAPDVPGNGVPHPPPSGNAPGPLNPLAGRGLKQVDPTDIRNKASTLSLREMEKAARDEIMSLIEDRAIEPEQRDALSAAVSKSIKNLSKTEELDRAGIHRIVQQDFETLSKLWEKTEAANEKIESFAATHQLTDAQRSSLKRAVDRALLDLYNNAPAKLASSDVESIVQHQFDSVSKLWDKTEETWDAAKSLMEDYNDQAVDDAYKFTESETASLKRAISSELLERYKTDPDKLDSAKAAKIAKKKFDEVLEQHEERIGKLDPAVNEGILERLKATAKQTAKSSASLEQLKLAYESDDLNQINANKNRIDDSVDKRIDSMKLDQMPKNRDEFFAMFQRVGDEEFEAVVLRRDNMNKLQNSARKYARSAADQMIKQQRLDSQSSSKSWKNQPDQKSYEPLLAKEADIIHGIIMKHINEKTPASGFPMNDDALEAKFTKLGQEAFYSYWNQRPEMREKHHY